MGPEEFSRTYLPLRDATYRVALHLLESSDDAMDAVQDLYIRLWERRDALDAVRNPGAYCITLVRNICIDRIRSAAKIDRKAEVGECGASYPPPDERLQARQQLAGRAATLLVVAAAGGHNQNLASGMAVPVIAAAGLEGDVVERDVERLVGGQGRQVGAPGEILCIDGRILRTLRENLPERGLFIHGCRCCVLPGILLGMECGREQKRRRSRQQGGSHTESCIHGCSFFSCVGRTV